MFKVLILQDNFELQDFTVKLFCSCSEELIFLNRNFNFLFLINSGTWNMLVLHMHTRNWISLRKLFPVSVNSVIIALCVLTFFSVR